MNPDTMPGASRLCLATASIQQTTVKSSVIIFIKFVNAPQNTNLYLFSRRVVLTFVPLTLPVSFKSLLIS